MHSLHSLSSATILNVTMSAICTIQIGLAHFRRKKSKANQKLCQSAASTWCSYVLPMSAQVPISLSGKLSNASYECSTYCAKYCCGLYFQDSSILGVLWMTQPKRSGKSAAPFGCFTPHMLHLSCTKGSANQLPALLPTSSAGTS